MKNIIYSNALIFFLSFNPAWSQIDEVNGLGKIERLERLETLVTSLQAEVRQLKSALGASSSDKSAADSAQTFVRHSDLLSFKSDLSMNVEREVREVKSSMARADQRVGSLAQDLSEIKEGQIKDINFKIEVLQKSLEALERSQSTP